MFAWANQQLSKLADTLAPVPAMPSLRFLSACSSQDEVTALACLDPAAQTDGAPPMEPYAVLNPAKGMQPIHYATSHGLIQLTQTLLTQYHVPVDTFDYQGNSPLHHACMTSDGSPIHLHLIQMLVKEFNASVVVKNSEGKTPYDVASGANVRNWLLPLQLQQETKTALENGGIGLIPGMDMGGYTVVNPAIGAPPILGVAPPPIAPPVVGAPPVAPHCPPTIGQFSEPNTPAAAVMSSPLQPFGGSTPSAIPLVPPTATTTASTTPLPTPPISGGYSGTTKPHQHARYNNSSAPTSANLRYRPDGFHSSASDTTLQQKYGHVQVRDFSGVPPPPASLGGGNGAMSAHTSTAQGSTAAAGMPPPPFTYSAFSANKGAVVPRQSRYLAYDALTGQAIAMPDRQASASPMYNNNSAGVGVGVVPSSAAGPPKFNVFTPDTPNMAAVPMQSQANNLQPQGAGTGSFASPVTQWQFSQVALPQQQQNIGPVAPSATMSPYMGMSSSPIVNLSSPMNYRSAVSVFDSLRPNPRQQQQVQSQQYFQSDGGDQEGEEDAFVS